MNMTCYDPQFLVVILAVGATTSIPSGAQVGTSFLPRSSNLPKDFTHFSCHVSLTPMETLRLKLTQDLQMTLIIFVCCKNFLQPTIATMAVLGFNMIQSYCACHTYSTVYPYYLTLSYSANLFNGHCSIVLLPPSAIFETFGGIANTCKHPAAPAFLCFWKTFTQTRLCLARASGWNLGLSIGWQIMRLLLVNAASRNRSTNLALKQPTAIHQILNSSNHIAYHCITFMIMQKQQAASKTGTGSVVCQEG